MLEPRQVEKKKEVGMRRREERADLVAEIDAVGVAVCSIIIHG